MVIGVDGSSKPFWFNWAEEESEAEGVEEEEEEEEEEGGVDEEGEEEEGEEVEGEGEEDEGGEGIEEEGGAMEGSRRYEEVSQRPQLPLSSQPMPQQPQKQRKQPLAGPHPPAVSSEGQGLVQGQGRAIASDGSIPTTSMALPVVSEAAVQAAMNVIGQAQRQGLAPGPGQGSGQGLGQGQGQDPKNIGKKKPIRGQVEKIDITTDTVVETYPNLQAANNSTGGWTEIHIHITSLSCLLHYNDRNNLLFISSYYDSN